MSSPTELSPARNKRQSLERVKISLDLGDAALVNSVETLSLDETQPEQIKDTKPTTSIPSTSTTATATTNTGQPLQVYLRIRPNLQETKEEPCITVLNDTKVQAIAPKTSQSYKTGERGPTELQFSHVFKQDATQEQVFDKAVLPVVDSFLEGNDGLVFAYGITNAGKTHTIRGTNNSPGVLPRALNNIFLKLNEEKEKCSNENENADTKEDTNEDTSEDTNENTNENTPKTQTHTQTHTQTSTQRKHK